MKISKEELKKIIKEELESEFGKASVSTGDRTKDMKSQASDAGSQKGVDNSERGIIKQFNDRLQKLAQLSNIKGGRINSVLKKVYSLMDEEIQKLESGDKSDEK